MITTTKESEATVVNVTVREAKFDKADHFRSELVQLIDRGEKQLILDFSQVTYMDSSFLGALVSSLKHALAKKGEILVVGLNKDIDNLFRLIRMDKVFKIFPRVPEALHFFHEH